MVTFLVLGRNVAEGGKIPVGSAEIDISLVCGGLGTIDGRMVGDATFCGRDGAEVGDG
jgi:hypothetical protein